MDRDDIKATTTVEELEIGKLLGFDHLEVVDGEDAETTVGVAYNKRGEGTVSDRRLKTDMTHVGKSTNGLSLYDFRYLGSNEVFRGVMAQDLLADARFAEAVATDGPYYRVDYAKLGLAHLVTDAMRVAGARALAVGERTAV